MYTGEQNAAEIMVDVKSEREKGRFKVENGYDLLFLGISLKSTTNHPDKYIVCQHQALGLYRPCSCKYPGATVKQSECLSHDYIYKARNSR